VQPFIDVDRPLDDADYARARSCACRITLPGLSKLVYGSRISDSSCISLTFQRLLLSNPLANAGFELGRHPLRHEPQRPLANQVQVMYGGTLHEIMQLARRLNSPYSNTMRVVQCEMSRMRGICNQHPALSTPRRMVQAQLRYNMQQAQTQSIDQSVEAERYKRSPSSVVQDLTRMPLRYRDERRTRRKKRRNVMFEKLRSDKRLIEQDDSLVEQALTPLEAVLLTYSLIDHMVRDNVFVPWNRLATSVLIDDLQQLMSVLQSWKSQTNGDALVSGVSGRVATRELPLSLEMDRVARALEVLERERGDMRTALHIAAAAAWKYHEANETLDETSHTSHTNHTSQQSGTTDYVELSRLKPMA